MVTQTAGDRALDPGEYGFAHGQVIVEVSELWKPFLESLGQVSHGQMRGQAAKTAAVALKAVKGILQVWLLQLVLYTLPEGQ